MNQSLNFGGCHANGNVNYLSMWQAWLTSHMTGRIAIELIEHFQLNCYHHVYYIGSQLGTKLIFDTMSNINMMTTFIRWCLYVISKHGHRLNRDLLRWFIPRMLNVDHNFLFGNFENVDHIGASILLYTDIDTNCCWFPKHSHQRSIYTNSILRFWVQF